MSMTESQRLANTHAPALNTLISEYRAKAEQGIQAFGAELREKLEEFGLGSKQVVHHSKLCPHEDNRDGELLIPIAVWQLMLKIRGGVA